MAKHPAIILDRDGTIIEDTGYIKHKHKKVIEKETIIYNNVLEARMYITTKID